MTPWYLSDPGTRDWIHRIYSVLEADGSALVEALGTPNEERASKCGISDNCYAADRLLDWLVDEKWIEPVSYNPSVSQRFFGVGGRASGRQPRKPVWRGSHTYPQEWRFRVNQESADLIAYVRGGITADMRSRSAAARTSVPKQPEAVPGQSILAGQQAIVDAAMPATEPAMEPRGSIESKADELGSKIDTEAAEREAAQRRSRAEAPQTPNEVRAAVDKLTMGTHARIVDSLFDMPDPMEEYLTIKSSLTFGGRASSMSYGQLVDALDDAQSIAERASRLLASAKVTHDAFHLDAEVIRGALREQAVDDLQQQKAKGERSKAITNDDITAVMSAKFPDEYRDLELRAGKARRMVAAIEQLYDRACARAGDLRAMVQRTREV